MSENVIELYDEVEAENKVHADRICKLLGSALVRAYPNRNWYVSVKGGVADIHCPDISMRYGYCLHINEQPDILERKAVRAGGEILERFRLSRSAFADGADVNNVRRNILGEAVAAHRGEL